MWQEMTDNTTAKSDSKAASKTETASEGDSGKKAESSASDASKGYSRGENQKLVTEAYRNNWNDIFGKKPRRRSKR
ncbi:MAG: hypothetical protein AAF495_18130 [Pseudomonadota bacterium]